jgi:hypothetical protein
VVETLVADLRCSSGLAEVGRRWGREASTIGSAVRRLRQRAVTREHGETAATPIAATFCDK